MEVSHEMLERRLVHVLLILFIIPYTLSETEPRGLHGSFSYVGDLRVSRRSTLSEGVITGAR